MSCSFNGRLVPVLLVLASMLLTSCRARSGAADDSGDPAAQAAPEPTQAAGGQAVKIDNFTFDPPTLTVAVGTKVTWTNRDDVPHTVTSTRKPRLLDSPTLDTDDSFTHVFTAPGTYEYYCTVHPKMTGKIIVK
jgi:amicyanin